jgi:hypothetical protein
MVCLNFSIYRDLPWLPTRGFDWKPVRQLKTGLGRTAVLRQGAIVQAPDVPLMVAFAFDGRIG